jgi:DNA-directed RNA polymerase subunit H (RpoH/RPB5)
MKLTKSKLKEMIKEVINEAKLKDVVPDIISAAAKYTHHTLDHIARRSWDSSDDLIKKIQDYISHPKLRTRFKRDVKQLLKQHRIQEADLPTTTKKDKTVTVVHKTSGKELVVTDTSSTRKKYKRMGYFVQADPRKIKKALMIAKKMSGDMTGAVKKIERIEKDLSNNHDVANALKTANESINEETSDKDAALEVIDYVKQALNATKSKKPYAKDWYSTAMQGVLQYWGGRVAKDLGIRDDVEKIAYQSSIGKTDPSGWKTGSPSKKNQKAVEKILKKAEKNFKKIK